MSRLIDADALYERVCSLEAQAVDYVGKLSERDGDKVSVEWEIWSAVLTERIAFKHDVFDAPTIERKIGHWVEIGDEPYDEWECDMCGFVIDGSGCIDPLEYLNIYNYCPNCGARMSEGEENEKA